MDISSSGTLRIAGYEWRIVNSGTEFCQQVGVRGAPASKVQAQGLWVLLDGSGAVEDKLRTYAKNKLLFTKASSENIMDHYNQDRSFWHWQWALMQTDTINFSGSKVANQ